MLTGARPDVLAVERAGRAGDVVAPLQGFAPTGPEIAGGPVVLAGPRELVDALEQRMRLEAASRLAWVEPFLDQGELERARAIGRRLLGLGANA